MMTFLEKALSVLGVRRPAGEFDAVDTTREAAESALLDPAFRQLVERYFDLRAKHQREIQEVLASSNAFQSFLDAEAGLLARAGVGQSEAARLVLDLCSSPTRSFARRDDKDECCDVIIPIDLLVNRPPETTFRIVDQLRSALESTPARKKPDWGKVGAGAFHGALGLALVGLNGVGLAALGLPAPALQGLSGGLGAFACERGYNTIAEAFRL